MLGEKAGLEADKKGEQREGTLLHQKIELKFRLVSLKPCLRLGKKHQQPTAARNKKCDLKTDEVSRRGGRGFRGLKRLASNEHCPLPPRGSPPNLQQTPIGADPDPKQQAGDMVPPCAPPPSPFLAALSPPIPRSLGGGGGGGGGVNGCRRRHACGARGLWGGGDRPWEGMFPSLLS